ncbi:hypothetical protein K470DRAFT_198120, partial [Piedraia hortae CBS 480.64]
RWLLTPKGILWTLYGLNVVAWGGMLFLLLCNASKAMCWAPVDRPRYRNCNDINSPRRVWIEIDSQILNALFCVTGFGFLPWRLRDLYFLLRYRLCNERRAGKEKKLKPLRVLTGYYDWFRLDKQPTTAMWKMDVFVWAQIANTALQACLCGFMWGMSRYNRPAWATGLFIALACGVAAAGGLIAFLEGRKAVKVE